MIRHRQGNEFLLITQHEHALLAGRMAGQIGNKRFAPMEPAGPAVQGVSLHDSGWPLHDDAPTVDGKGLPLHVFETPTALACSVWSESARRAAEADPYSGLLVSLHVLHLSTYAQAAGRKHSPHELFEINKFQHRQVEVQEGLRKRLGMATHLPLRYGLAEPGTSDSEDRLLFNYRLLRAMDGLSLALCCSEEMFPLLEGVFPRPGSRPIDVQVARSRPFSVTVKPWIFGPDRLEAPLPCRRIPAVQYEGNQALRDALRQAAPEVVEVRIEPG